MDRYWKKIRRTAIEQCLDETDRGIRQPAVDKPLVQRGGPPAEGIELGDILRMLCRRRVDCPAALRHQAEQKFCYVFGAIPGIPWGILIIDRSAPMQSCEGKLPRNRSSTPEFPTIPPIPRPIPPLPRAVREERACRSLRNPWPAVSVSGRDWTGGRQGALSFTNPIYYEHPRRTEAQCQRAGHRPLSMLRRFGKRVETDCP